MCTSPNYGEQIRKIKEDIAAKAVAEAQRKAVALAAKIAYERDFVDNTFLKAWREMQASVDLSQLPKGVKVNGYNNGFRVATSLAGPDMTPDNPAHPSHDIYTKWNATAAAEGLTLHIVNNHDGAGQKDWYVVTFTLES